GQVLNGRNTEKAVKNHVGRKSNIGFALFYAFLAPGVPIVDVFGKIENLIFTPAQVHVPAKEFGKGKFSHKFNTPAVTTVNVGHNGRAHIVNLSGKHQLVDVSHVIDIGPQLQVGVVEGISGFDIVQVFGFRN